MTGITYTLEERGLTEAMARLNRLGRGDAKGELLDGVGALVASQTQRRIAEEKTSPSGAAWRPNKKGTSILYMSGALAGDIHHVAGGDEVRIGSNLVYAAIHQGGGMAGRGHKVEIPKREYLGLSAENRDELEELVDEFLEGLLQ